MREDWEVEALGDVCKVHNGSTPLRSKKEYWEDGNINWFTIDDIREQGREIFETKQKITQEGFKNSSVDLLPKDTVLICCTASIGEFAITKTELTTNQQFNGLVIRNSSKLIPRYLFHFARTLKNTLLKLSGKTTIDYVSMTKLRHIKIPLPPLEEQKRIVAILDDAFEAIGRARANIGRNIENAEELFQSKLNEIFSQRGEGLEAKKLKEICNVRPSKRQVKELLNADELVSYVPMSDLGINQKHFSGKEERTMGDAYKGYTYFEKEDVILAKITPCFENGKLGIAKDLKNGIGFGSTEFIVYRPKSDLSNEFLYYFLNRDSFRRVGESLMDGAVGHQRIQKEFYEDYMIHYPNLDKQKELVREMDNINELRSELVSLLNTKIEYLRELKKSILQQAFSGALTGPESGFAGLGDEQDELGNRAAESVQTYGME